MKCLKKQLLPLLASSLLPLAANADVRLPKLISDGMVLQRDAELKVWGWADPGEEVSVEFRNGRYHAKASGKGEWAINLPEMPAGGPYHMEIRGDNQIAIKDILVGDVWLSSGQSNMEYPMSRVAHHYPEEMHTSGNSRIRQFLVPQRYNFQAPQSDLSDGAWKAATAENLPDFSAVAYFFAKQVHAQEQVPIGILNASLGGSPAEAWVSEETLKKFPDHYRELQRFKDDSLIEKIEKADRERTNAWHREADKKDLGLNKWQSADLDIGDWDSMEIPGYWADTKLGEKNGVVWFRKTVQVPKSMAGKPATLILGRMVDADTSYINGEKVGNTTYLYPRRRYQVPAGLLKAGKNTIAIRITNEHGRGGFVLDKTYALVSGEQRLDLRGQWQYRLGTEMKPLAGQTFVRWKPTGLYNAMIHPLNNYKIKGAIWYQGESNAGRPQEYATLFPALIRDWRNDWNQGDFPFLFVQLANFMPAKEEPSESDWARLRESQRKTLSVPNTAMAVTIDIGEWNDVHPLNKKDVGKRLALAARNLAYGEEETIFSGPNFKSMRTDDNRIVLDFEHTGGGLVAKGDKLQQFAIAGADKRFVWAQAAIDGDKVVVWSKEVSRPVAVRYAWADNPEGANFYNREGLPATPFRTDAW